MFQPKLSFTYNDIGLKPIYESKIKSRKNVDTSTDFLGKELRLPVLAAPMAKVVGVNMGNTLTELGGLAFLPRTDDANYDYNLYIATKGNSIPSIPATGNYLERFKALRELGCRHFCIDVANGFHILVKEAVEAIRKLDEDCYLVTGNVASYEGYQYLASLGIDAVRVGIGGGSVCTTSIATGVGVGQASIVRECSVRSVMDYDGDERPLLIADGGIETPGDVAIALALGADVVMVGGLFAGTEESPGEVVIHNDKKYKHMAGQASMHIKGQRNFVEGADLLVPYKGSVEKVWNGISEGLKSSMAYMGCENLDEFKQLEDECFVQLSSAARGERGVHVNL